MAEEEGCLPDSMQEAIIVVIPKPGKDKLLPDSYQPISLLNLDVKLLAWILTNSLSKVIGGSCIGNNAGSYPLCLRPIILDASS